MPDANATKQIWKLKFGVSDAQAGSSTWLSQDDDGDGLTNDVEITAGTNPFSAGSVVRITSITNAATTVDLTFPTEIGKQYVVQATPVLTTAFTNAGVTWTGTGGSKTLTVTKGANKFFRVLVQDIDTDNDGVGNWAEQAVGLSPTVAETISGQSTLDYVNGQIALPNVVTITAAAPFASEEGPTAGKMTVTRSQNLFPITVTYGVGGTAVPTTDYSPLSGSVGFLARGATSADIFVNPVNQPAAVKGTRSVTAALNPSGAAVFPFVLGTANTATVIISDTTVPSGTGLWARYYDTSSTTYANSANFNAAQLRIDRVDPVVNNDWQYGTPNGVVIAPNNSPDNYSATWDAYLQPTTAGDYTFQLDADDKARVLLDTGSGLVQILEHNWTTPGSDPVGTFKQSAPITLAVPATPAARYHIRVEHVETTGDARCRLQWKLNNGAFANIAQANQFTHTQAATYVFTRASATAGTATITLAGHGLANAAPATVWFSAGNLFTANVSDPAGYSGTFTISNATANTFDVAISGTNLPASQNSTSCFLEDRSNSTTTGAFNKCYANTGFTGTPGRVGVDAAVTTGNNGIWNTGTPDAALIQPDTFSVRWTGQVQPQFSEDYTFVIQADDGCSLWINGQPQVLKMSPSANSSGSTYSYDAVTGDLVVTYSGSVAVPSSFIVGETVRLDPSSGNLLHAPTTSPTYTYDEVTGIAVIDYSNLTNRTGSSFVAGESVELDPTSGTVSLGNLPYTILSSPAPTSTTFAVNLADGASVAAGTFLTGGGNITINDTRNVLVTAATATTFTVNIGTGKYTTGGGNMNIDLVNKSLKDWSSNGNERYVRIPMVGGVRYDIQLDYYENTGAARCILSWFSASQPKQVIPSERLYPGNGPLAPTAHVTPTDATALVGGLFSHPVAGSNAATSVTISGNPNWLSYAAGVISGTPPGGAAGDYQIIITIVNAAGTSTSLLNLHVDENAGNVVREYWSGVTGTTVASIPTTAATGSSNLTTLEAPTGFGVNYGARVRGYITAPVTGNYYFWISSNNASELWISNDDQPVNALKRAWATAGSTTPRTWNAETTRKSPWLALEQGKKYYVEILHKAGTALELGGAGNDNLAVGWAKPGEATTAPSQVVPGFVLSPYVPPSLAQTPGTLYVATMLAQPGAVGVPPGSPVNGVGTSTLRLSADENTAYVKRSWSGLTGAITSEHVHADPYLNHGSQIIYDIDTPATAGDGLITNPNDPNYTGTNPQTGTYKWTIEGVAPLTKADIVEIIKQGKAYINLHTVANGNGEIRGNYTLGNGTRTFTPPPLAPAWTDDSDTDNGAARFLTQASFGGNISEINALNTLTASGAVPAANIPSSRYNTWLDNEFNRSPSQTTLHLPEVLAREIADAFGPFDVRLSINTWWKSSLSGPDQLRQRVALALSEIHVVSTQGPLQDNSRAISHFYDALVGNAFGNFRDILVDTTLTPGMGRYLDMLGNDKPDLSVGRSPNENYAREIKQLFSIGLYRMWPDGSLVLDSSDSPVPTYTQREIVGFAHTFTGWYYGYDGDYRTSFSAPATWTRPMREVPARHFTGPKRLLNNEVLPGLTSLGGQPLDPYATHISAQSSDPAYEALPAQELNAAHDQLFNHPNVGPFICRQLIQRLVTSNPSRDYLYRVVQKFNDNGLGVRGDMKAVIKAILLDYEARSSDSLAIPAFGKQREPMMRVANAARAFRTVLPTGTYSQTGALSNGAPIITITTATVHKLSTGSDVFLEFTDTTGDPAKPAPPTGTYIVQSVPSTTTYTILAPGWITGTYSQLSNSSTMTITMSGHWLPAGGQAYFNFTSGAANGVLGFDATTHTAITSNAVDFPGGSGNSSGTTFTIAGLSPVTGNRTGNVAIVRFSGSYGGPTSTAGTPGPITIDTAFVSASGVNSYGTQADHYLSAGDNVFINFTTTRDTTSFDETTTLNDLTYPVVTVPDPNSFTVTSRSAANAAIRSDNGVFIFPLTSQPLTRNGTVNRRAGTFTMDNTDGDIGQTPLSSPTVFNYFLPEYKYPGTLASHGITTPEFQTTAETTVVRHANFIYDGIFNPDLTSGISSFKTGTDALLLDFSPWLGNATTDGLGAGPQTGQRWTSNANLGTLIDHLNTLLLAGQLPAGAKTSIQNFLARTITSVSAAPSNPTVITSVGHGLVTGDSITISGVTGTFTGINGTFTVTRIDNDTFSVPVNHSSGTSTLTAAHFSTIPYDDGSPSTTNIRDRLRAIIHFILTSPDYTIQR